METYLPIVNGLLSDWLALTLNNPVYASVLAAVVFFVTAILYGFRISSLKKKAIARENAHNEEATRLNAELTISEQQLQAMQEVLTANNEQLKKDQHTAQIAVEKANKYETQLTQRNTQIAALIQSLATRIDLGERPLPIMGDIKAEGLWQQHDRVVNLLVTKLLTEQQVKAQLQESFQAEKIKSAESEVLVKSVQAALVTQANQLSLLEQALEDQKAILKVQQDKAQQVLAETIEKSNAELARIPELEQQLLSLANTQQQLSELKEVLTTKEALILQLENVKIVPAPDVKLTPEVKKDEPKPISIKPEVKVSEIPVAIEKVEPPVLVESSHGQTDVPGSVKKEPASGLTGKFKGLFGKKASTSIDEKTEPVETVSNIPDIEPEPLFIEPRDVRPLEERPTGVAGKFKGLLGRKNTVAPVIDAPKEVEIIPAVVNAQPEPIVIKPQAETVIKENNVGLSGKFKNLFGKNNSTDHVVEQPEVVEIVPVVVESEPEPEPVQLAVPLGPIEVIKEDVARVTSKLKGLFGKGK
ncbi:MAG: hypothetical protein WCG16_01725 [Methylococcales bacterium]